MKSLVWMPFCGYPDFFCYDLLYSVLHSFALLQNVVVMMVLLVLTIIRFVAVRSRYISYLKRFDVQKNYGA